MRKSIAIAPALVLALAGAVAAQPFAWPELRVNETTDGRQQAPVVDTDAAGNFVVVWRTGDDGWSVAARRFSAAGVPLGGEIAVYSASAPGNFPALAAAVAVDADGDFVVVWQHDGVFAQRFAASGTPLGGRIVVAEPPFGRDVDVAIDDAGDFVVVWDSQGEVFLRLFGANGAALGPATPVASSAFTRLRPAVARNGAGRFVVAWQSVEQDFPCQAPDGDCFGEEYGVFARVYSASGQPLSGEILVNTQVEGNQEEADVGIAADGRFVVVWQDFSPTWNTYAQRFDAAGNRLGGEFRLNTLVNATDPEIAMHADGRFDVVQSVFTGTFDGSDLDVVARRFDAEGRPLAPEFAVNMETALRQHRAAIAPTPTGFVATWSSTGQDGSLEGIYARVFGVSTAGGAPAIGFGGNGDTDVAVFRPADGRWLADFDFQPGAELSFVYGRSGDVPVPKDYDGDGTTDFAVFRPSTRNWFVDTDRNGGTNFQMTYGASSDVPVPADYDGDGRADLAVWRPASGTWFVDVDRNGGTDLQAVFGESGSIPVPGDYDGDGRTDFAVFHQGAWRIDTDRNGVSNLTIVYGRAGDVPVPGDYDGDGKTDFALFRPASGTWFVDVDRNGGTDLQIVYGRSGDVPVAGDFDGDGRTDFAVHRPASGVWYVDTNRNGGTDLSVGFGEAGDVPLRENGWIVDRLGVVP